MIVNIINYTDSSITAHKPLLLAVFILILVIYAQYVTCATEHQVTNSSAKADSKEQPAIVGHGHKHQDVPVAHLNYMQGRL